MEGVPPFHHFSQAKCKEGGDVDTRSPSSPTLHHHITHNGQVQGHSRSVTPLRVDPRYRPTLVCPAHHNHTRENIPGAPPHIVVVVAAGLPSVLPACLPRMIRYDSPWSPQQDSSYSEYNINISTKYECKYQ